MKVDPAFPISDGSWNTGQYYDTMVSTFYPPNLSSSSTPSEHLLLRARRGRQPASGWAEFRVRGRLGAFHQEFDPVMDVLHGEPGFLRRLFAGWNLFDSTNWLFVNNGAILGVYQQLSTRNGAEVISADQY